MAPVLIGVFASSVAAQQPPTAELQKELSQLGVMADSLEHSLPSFACTEEVVSELLLGSKVKKHIEFTAEIRTQRAGNGMLDESFTLQTLDGRAVAPEQSSPEPPYVRYKLPIYVKGGFDHAMSYFATSHQACYQFRMSDSRIDFETASDLSSQPQCRNDQVRGFALLDAQGNIVHIERRVSPEAARAFGLVSYAAIDFAPVELNRQTFWLSSHVLAEIPVGKQTARFQATYTGCHLFAATVTIGPATVAQPMSPPHP